MTFINLSLLFCALAFPSTNDEPKILSIGESLTLPSHLETSIRIQKKGLLSVKDQGTRLILVGKKVGTTKVYFGKKVYKVIVTKKISYNSYRQLKEWKKDLRGPLVDVKEKGISINGRILRMSDFLNLNNFTDENSDFKIKATLSQTLQQQVSRKVKNLLKNNNLSPGELIFSPHIKLLLGKKQKPLLSQYKKILNPYGIQIEVNPHLFHQKPVIKIKLHIAHIKKSFFRNFGMKWPGEFTATVTPSSFNINDFNFSLQSLESEGLGKVLASPTLIAESGKKAQFHSGGEFPVRTSSQFSNSVHWKPYGLFLKILPKASTNGSLQIFVETEVSAIDKSVAADGVPGMIRSKVETTFNMKTPRPVVLSGLIQTDSGKSREGLAWLSQIPILKPLFSRSDIYNNEYELVFILSPSLL